MLSKEIIVGNKLIDSFMGNERHPLKDYSWEHTIAYRTSWDWLMPVVDKVNSMGKEFSCAIFKNYVSLTVEKGGNKFYKDFSFSHAEYITSEQTGKEAMFKLLVKFVEWHNSNVNIENLEVTK
jgi:hypothetical protein